MRISSSKPSRAFASSWILGLAIWSGCTEPPVPDEGVAHVAQFSRTVGYPASADTSICEGSWGSNGASPYLYLGQSGTATGSFPNSAHRVLLWFNLSGLNNLTVNGVTLRVWNSSGSPAATGTVHVNSMRESWAEGVTSGSHGGGGPSGANWYEANSGFTAWGGGAGGGAFTWIGWSLQGGNNWTPNSAAYFDMNNSAGLNAEIQGYANGLPNYGLMLTADAPGNRKLVSREGGLPPTLYVDFDCNVGYVDSGAPAGQQLCNVSTAWCSAPGNGTNATFTGYSGGYWSGVPSYLATANYACANGYQQASGSMTATCQSNRTWTALPSCSAISNYCGSAPSVANASASVSGGAAGGTTASIGATAAYTCSAGYVGNAGSPATCNYVNASSGAWSTPTFACTVNTTLCPAPASITNATAALTGGIGGDGTRSLNATLSYGCVAGYTSSSPVTATCQSNGTWSTTATVTCTPTVPYCAAPPDIANDSGVVTYSGGASPGNNGLGATALYTCGTGYAGNGGTLPTCQASGAWSAYTYACDPVASYCAAAPPSVSNAIYVVAGGVAGPGTQSYGATASYACVTGYVGNAGTSSLCQADRTWSATTFSCSVNTSLCAVPSLVTNASFTLVGGLGGDGTRSLGATLSYACATGYTASNRVDATCTASGWSTTAGITCTPTVPFCAAPPDIADDTGTVTYSGGASPGNNSLNATANYTCNTGYAGSGTLPVCQSSGTWSSGSYACTLVNPYCAASPPTVARASYGISGGIGGGSSSTFGATATYACDLGYVGNSGTHSTCQASRNWSAPTFACASNDAFCGAVPTVANATSSLVGGVGGNGTRSYGATAVYACNVGYVDNLGTDASCQSDGTWTSPSVACTPVDCGAAPAVANASAPVVSGGVAGGTTYQATAAYTCGSGYQKVGSDASCQASGTWSAAPFCNDVNECGTVGLCGVGTCTNLPGTYSCSCPAGYVFAGGTCTLNDACVAFDPCDDLATCTPTIGTPVYACTCPSGYAGSGIGAGSCTDVNECAEGTRPCAADEACTNSAGSFACTACGTEASPSGAPGVETCTCNAGYAGNPYSACTDVDECALTTDDCDAQATCTNTTGSFSCACNAGYAGDGVNCADVDECAAGDPCDPSSAISGETCSNLPGSYACSCPAGYGFSNGTCELTNACNADSDDCAVDAICTPVGATMWTCTCKAGFTGTGQVCTDVNECLAGTDDCSPDATCTNVAGSFSCSCNSGYFGGGRGLNGCADVNECVAGTDDCNATNATCTNTVGSYVCGCATGFTGDGVTSCSDVDECATGADDCDTNAACTNTTGSFSCACNAGYVGSGRSCADVNECGSAALNDCDDANSVCSNTAGSFTCSCAAGYSGSGVGIGSCLDDDECALGTDTCHANAACTNTAGSYTCACASGYAGNGYTACDDVDECLLGLDDCGADATCTNTTGAFSCACNAGYTGDGVSCVDVDECATGADDCSPEATCTNTPGAFSCACAAGYQGAGRGAGGCADVDECATGSYSCPVPNAACANTVGAYECLCGVGYAGDGDVACVDLDECALGTDDCDSIATCVNTAGSFACDCPDGFPGNGHGEGNCADVDECALGTDDCNAPNSTCTNTLGSFDCGCALGFAGDGRTFCDDVNECMDGTHDCTVPNSMCANTTGSFDCVCAVGYAGDGRTSCADVDECALGTDSCNVLNAVCNNLPGSFTCGCAAGYAGDGVTSCADVDECQLDTDDCVVAQATCTNTDGAFTCGCAAGYAGDGRTSCVDVDECAAGTFTCGANQACANTDGAYACVCVAGYTDDGAGGCTDVDECANGTFSCTGPTTCSNTVGGYDCICSTGYQDDGAGGCADVDECTTGAFTCGTNEACLNTVGGYGCACATGYVDDGSGACVDVDECTSGTSLCAVDQACVNTDGSYTCACGAGYAWDGTTCGDVDECAAGTFTCHVLATCQNTVGDYDCACRTGYAGDGRTTCTDVDECTDGTANCAATATCANTLGSFDCTCNAGYTGNGTTCADIDDCAPTSCGANEVCVNQVGSPFTCVCAGGTSRPVGQTTCQVVCGDGLTHATEQCDDDNAANGDGCSAQCRVEAGWSCYEATLGGTSACTQTCGDGLIDPGEQCDDGANNSDTVAGACRTNCRLPGCGDGRLDAGEECDNGANNSDTVAGACRTSCMFAFCGDGVIDSARGEVCDPGGGQSLAASVCESSQCARADGGMNGGATATGCGCRTAGDESTNRLSGAAAVWFALAAVVLRRRRR